MFVHRWRCSKVNIHREKVITDSVKVNHNTMTESFDVILYNFIKANGVTKSICKVVCAYYMIVQVHGNLYYEYRALRVYYSIFSKLTLVLIVCTRPLVTHSVTVNGSFII